MQSDIYHPDQDHYFGGGGSETFIHPVVLVGMLITIVLILCLPRKYAIGPFLVAAFLFPLSQQIYVIGVHWFVGRLIILAGLAGLACGKKGSFFPGGYNAIDRAYLWCTVCQAAAFVLLYKDGQALVNQVGFLIDFLGAYVLLRALLLDDEGVYRALKWIAFLTVLLAFTMVREQQTLHNIFGIIGGADAPLVREGKIRAQGSFGHSLTAGTFSATLVPMFILLWRCGRAKVAAAAGLAGCTVMTMCSNSSTPLLAYTAGVLGVCLWPIRHRMRNVRRGLVFTLVALHLVMKAPVWFLLARIDLTGGSSGYHRAELVDQCIRHFWDWWLIGTKDAGTWGYDLWDSQNQYVQVAECGGLAALVFMILMIKRLYASLGNARKLLPDNPRQQWAFWLLGSALFAHLTGFFGINYFDQARVNWFLLLAAIVAFTNPVLQGGFRQESSEKTTAPDPANGWFQQERERSPAASIPVST